MSVVTIRNVEFLNNPARFLDKYKFRVTFECISALSDDLEWKLIYVSSPGQTEYDQELEDCMVGPVPIGINSFEFESDAPNPHRIPHNDVLGVAALILTASYKDQEFVRVGYYQNTEYDNDEMKENPPATPRFEFLVRDLATKPKVTRFMIKWDNDQVAPGMPSAQPTSAIPAPFAPPGSAFPRQGAMAVDGPSEFAASGAVPMEGVQNNYAATSSAVPPAVNMAQRPF
ncbi:Histone chaperone asf1 [Tulasnella sp. UAMH 9824]|nr:Histone chaperone asf1 [Tulasnella sp. UAMH 9824]